jgi:hypothetical protein
MGIEAVTAMDDIRVGILKKGQRTLSMGLSRRCTDFKAIFVCPV